MSSSEYFDYIIVGAGSAGCVLAYRLSEDPRNKVLLIEAGPKDSSRFIRIPMAVGKLASDPAIMWYYAAEPEPMTGNRSGIWLRGKVLGGSSSVNGMVYTRGNPADYDGWEAAGATGWGWETIKSAFMAIEDHELGANDHRGAGGPLHVSIFGCRTPLTEALLRACASLGTPVKADINDPLDQTGVGYSPMTVKRGRRVSAADAFLRPAGSRPNLKIATDTFAERILFQGRNAVGISCRRAGEQIAYQAGREIVLSAGVIGSPKILQLSGIGAASDLQKAGIAPILDSPGVGANLSEHKAIQLSFRLRQGHSRNQQLRGVNLLVNAARHQVFGTGPLAGTVDINGFMRSRPDLNLPDAQISFWSISARPDSDRLELENKPGLTMMGWQLRPESRGQVTLRSSQPHDMPIIRANFLATEEDRRVTIDTFRFFRAVAATPDVAPFVEMEMLPGADVQTDEAILHAVCQQDNGYHGTGTCRMGSDSNAVTDPQLRVNGVSNLRVVDCSVMPTQVSSGPNGPVMALAWRAADLILAANRG